MNKQYLIHYETIFTNVANQPVNLEGRTLGISYCCSLCRNGFYMYKSIMGKIRLFPGKGIYDQPHKCKECKRINAYITNS